MLALFVVIVGVLATLVTARFRQRRMPTRCLPSKCADVEKLKFIVPFDGESYRCRVEVESLLTTERWNRLSTGSFIHHSGMVPVAFERGHYICANCKVFKHRDSSLVLRHFLFCFDALILECPRPKKPNATTKSSSQQPHRGWWIPTP